MNAARAGWQKVSPALAALFDATLPDSPLVQRRQMFGCPCAFVNGNMFAGLHEQRLIVRLPDEAAARPFVVMGRTMKEYAAFDDALGLGEDAMRRWIDAAFRRTQSLPPKARRPATGRASAKTAAKAAPKRRAAPRKA